MGAETDVFGGDRQLAGPRVAQLGKGQATLWMMYQRVVQAPWTAMLACHYDVLPWRPSL